MAACLFWTGSAELPLTFVERIYQAYVHPSMNLGLECVPQGPQLARYQNAFTNGVDAYLVGQQVHLV